MFNFNFNFNLKKEKTETTHTPAELKKIVKNICEFKKNEIENINWQMVGDYILQEGYKTFLNVVFNLIENRPLETHKIQLKIEETFDSIEKQEIKRLVLNMPPRAGKSNNARYFCLYTMLKYSGVNYIYTSYNAELLVEFAGEIRKILDNPLIIEMFGLNKADSELANYEYSFYDSYFKTQMEAVAKSTNKKIKIRNNNLYLMCVGTTTGLGSGVENKDEFCGGLICDDLDKITNVYIDGKDNEKTKQWFSAVLLSRLQGSAFLLVIQQRLSKKDISGYILENYNNFEHIALPLIADDGTCNIPYYKEERIRELQLDNEVWQAQYQQQPINDLGVMPFADCPVVNYRNQRGDWVAWFDPAGSGKDYSALALIRRHGVMLEVLGWQWRKDWRFVVSDLLKIDELVDIRKLIVEINFTGDIIIQNLLELGIQCYGHRTTKNKIKKILAMQIYAQNINLVEFREFESKANKDFINNVLDWSKGAKHDDGADALSSYLDYSGLINS